MGMIVVGCLLFNVFITLLLYGGPDTTQILHFKYICGNGDSF